MRAHFVLATFVSLFALTRVQGAGDVSPVLSIANEELLRSFDVLKKQPVPAYFLSYEIIDQQDATIVGSFGTLLSSNHRHNRNLLIDLRVGDYSFDNTREIRGGVGMNNGNRPTNTPLVVEDDAAAIRNQIWFDTDRKYKQAIEQLTRLKTNDQVKVENEDKAGDFSKAKPEQADEPLQHLQVDQKLWEEKVRKYTAPFQRFGNIYRATAYFSAETNTRWFVSSEGAKIQHVETMYRLLIDAVTKADDGMDLPRYESFASLTPNGLPDDATVLKAVDKMIADLKALKVAPLVDPYTGPAILSGRAAGVFFHEVFGHRVEGQRQKTEADGQTFKKLIGQPVLPVTMSVYFDPTIHRYADTDLVGGYDYDDQGVKARRVTVVDDGILKSFLMSRAPIDGFPDSNGHGRAAPGYMPVARQSNLIVTESKPVTRQQLKQMLLDEMKKQNKPFGLLFDDIQGGFTLTGRTIPNAFNVLPIMVYKVLPDGSEELVRGVDLIGTPLTVFSKILAADNEKAVFNGICGAESGGVPVSASAPAILLSQIEVQKKNKSQERSPILSPPFDDR